MEHHHKPKVSSGIILIIIICLIMLLIYFNRNFFIEMLRTSPAMWAFYKHITYQIEEHTLLGLFYSSVLGSLFFIFLPSEVIFLYYTFLHYHPALLIAISLAGSVAGMIANYMIGWILGKGILRLLMKKNYEKLSSLNDKFGALIIVIGNMAMIFPSQLYSVIVGATRYRLKKFILYTAIGILAKYIMLILGKNYFVEVIVPWVRGFF